MNVLVTGATGPFGRAVCRQLLADGHGVIAMARRPSAAMCDGVKFVSGDVRDAPRVESAMRGCEAVVHLAWVVSPLKSRDETREINVGGTRNVLDAMAATRCRRLVFSSSVLAYGAVPGHPPLLREDDERRPAPEHAYAADKVVAEDLIADRGVESVVVRAGIIVGRDVDNVVFRFFSSPFLPSPDAGISQQFVHADDVARFTARAVSSASTGAVNVTGEQKVTMATLAELLGRRLVKVPERALRAAVGAGWKLNVTEVAPEEMGALLWMPAVDTTRMRERWGFTCAWSSHEAVQDLARRVRGRITLGKTTMALPWSLPLYETGALSRVRAALLGRTYLAEVTWLEEQLRAAAAFAGGPRPERRQAARDLRADLATHGDRLVEIGEQVGAARSALERARAARTCARAA